MNNIEVRNYYYFNGVVNVFREKLHDDTIEKNEILFVLNLKKFPFMWSSKRKARIYDKRIINSYFYTEKDRNEIRHIIDKFRKKEIDSIINEIQNKQRYDDSTLPQGMNSKDVNKNLMIGYIRRSDVDYTPEEDMDYVSDQLLYDDDVMYESESDDLSDVDTEWKPKEGLFKSKSPRTIYTYLMRHSKDKWQAMKRLTFYMNRAGENLTNKTVLNKVKRMLKTDN